MASPASPGIPKDINLLLEGWTVSCWSGHRLRVVEGLVDDEPIISRYNLFIFIISPGRRYALKKDKTLL